MVLPILGLVLLDGLYLYAALALAFIGLLICLENDQPGWCTFDIIVVLLGLQFLTSVHPVQYVMQNPMDIIVVVVGYLAAGTAWIFVKWLWHVNKIQNKFDAIKNEKMKYFINDFGPTAVGKGNRGYKSDYFAGDGTITDNGKEAFLKSCAYDIGERCLPMQVSQYKSKLYMWWICWPASIFWTFFADFLKSVWTWVYNRLNGILQRISDSSIKMPS